MRRPSDFILAFLVILVISLVLFACQPSPEAPLNEVYNIQSFESGNWSWISLAEVSEDCKDDVINEYKELIARAIVKWEYENSDRRIVDMDIMLQSNQNGYCSELTGISIYSIPIR